MQLQFGLCVGCKRKVQRNIGQPYVWRQQEAQDALTERDGKRRAEALAERSQAPPPPLPQESIIGSTVQIRSLGGALLDEVVVDDQWASGGKLDSHDLVRKLKSLLQERLGIPVCEQRLIMDESWQHATMVRVVAPPALLVKREEKVAVEFQADGTLCGEAICNGSFEVTSLDAKAGPANFRFTPKDPQWKHKVHPFMKRAAFAEEDLLTPVHPSNPSRCLQLYRPTPLLKWHLKSDNTDSLPVSLFFSATHSTHGTRSVLEVELKHDNLVIEDVRISFSPSVGSPSNVDVDIGEVTRRGTQWLWQVPAFNANESKGRLEFCAAADAMSMAPIVFKAMSRCHALNPIELIECYNQETEERIVVESEAIQTYEIVLQ